MTDKYFEAGIKHIDHFATACPSKTNTMGGVSSTQMSYQKVIFSKFNNPFRVKENLFKIKRNLLPKNRITGFSLDRLGGI